MAYIIGKRTPRNYPANAALYKLVDFSGVPFYAVFSCFAAVRIWARNNTMAICAHYRQK